MEIENIDEITRTSAIHCLPFELVDTILDKINDCEDRRNAHLVCSLWDHLLNEQPPKSCEYYSIYERFMVPLFISFRRTQMSYRFHLTDLRKTDQFWQEKGEDIGSLFFSGGFIPLHLFVTIIQSCNRLKEITLRDTFEDRQLRYRTLFLINFLVKRNIVNNSVRSVSLPDQFCFLNSNKLDSPCKVMELVRQIAKIFPNVSNLTIGCIDFPLLLAMDFLAKHFNKLKCCIRLKHREYEDEGDEIIFNYSKTVPLSMITFTFYMTENERFVEHTMNYLDIYEFLNRNPLLKEFRISKPIIDENISVFETSKSTFQVENIIIGETCEAKVTSCKPIGMSPSFISSFPKLKILKLESCSYDTFQAICNFLPFLKHLHISICSNCEISSDGIKRDDGLSKLQNLEVLFIPSCFLIKQREVLLNKLKRFSINGYKCQTKYLHFDCGNTKFPSLINLQLLYMRLYHCCKITKKNNGKNSNAFGNWLNVVMNKYPKLETVNIFGCPYKKRIPRFEDVDPIFKKYTSNPLRSICFNQTHFVNLYLPSYEII